MNLIFGKGEENDEFYKYVLFPQAALKFEFTEKGFEEIEINLNALYFSLEHHLGFSIDWQSLGEESKLSFETIRQKEKDLFKSFGKIAKPFSADLKIRMKVKSKVY